MLARNPRLFAGAALFLTALILAGCPTLDREFTNAYRHSCYDWMIMDGAAPTGEGEGEGDTAVKDPREVVEPDVIRRDENVLYILNQHRGLMLVDLDTEQVLSQVPTYGRPRDLYVQDGRAYVTVANASQYQVYGAVAKSQSSSRLFVVDIGDPESAHVIGEPFDFNGDLVDSRLVGDVIYAVCAEHQFSSIPEGGVGQSIEQSWVTSINISNPASIHVADELSFEGMGNVIQATDSALFVAGYDYSSTEGDSTAITYVDISDPFGTISVREPRMRVKGIVQDKFKMDVYDGFLRVASGQSSWLSSRNVYITTFNLADPELKPWGELLLDGATGESLFATRFDGPRGYIVTYLVKDPLWIIDLSDPANPKVEGELVIDGYSTYIEPRGDRLLALGVDNVTSVNRVSCSMFDVSDPKNPALVGEPVIVCEGWSYSPAYSDVKAMTILDDLIIVPVTGWNDQEDFDRLQLVSYSPGGLVKRGAVDVEGEILRSFEYGQYCYGLTSEELATIDLSNLDQPQVVSRLMLAEDAVDYLELTPEVEAVIVRQDNKSTVRTMDHEGGLLDEVTVELQLIDDAYVHGQSVILVGYRQSADTYSCDLHVVSVDCSAPGDLNATDTDLGVNPYWYWYRSWYADAMYERDMMIPGYWPGTYSPRNSYLLGDYLAVRCRAEEDKWTSVAGDNAASEGLAIVNLTTMETRLVGLGFDDYLSQIDSAGGKLYITTMEIPMTLPTWDWNNMECAYFIREFDPETATAGPAANVPGIYVQYVPESNILVLRDDQWQGDKFVSRLHTVAWDGGPEVSLSLDQADLPENASAFLAHGRSIYMISYPGTLYKASVSILGAIEISDGVNVSDSYAQLVEATQDQVYVGLWDYYTGQGTLAMYNLDEDPPLQMSYSYMGTLESLRISDNGIRVALGFGGFAVLP